ncbi:MAG: hypothetical protein WCZ23_13815 [Rhodospirillaceae bacterium]
MTPHATVIAAVMGATVLVTAPLARADDHALPLNGRLNLSLGAGTPWRDSSAAPFTTAGSTPLSDTVTVGVGYGYGRGPWHLEGSAQALWFTQPSASFIDGSDWDTAPAIIGDEQLALSGRLTYGADLSTLSPGLEGSFAPWAAADAFITTLPSAPALTESGPVHGRLRMGVDITPDGGPAFSLQGGATDPGNARQSFDARAGLRLKF